jgi:hypothetical protein
MDNYKTFHLNYNICQLLRTNLSGFNEQDTDIVENMVQGQKPCV